MTYRAPKQNMRQMLSFCLIGIRKFQTIGIGNRSSARSTTVLTTVMESCSVTHTPWSWFKGDVGRHLRLVETKRAVP